MKKCNICLTTKPIEEFHKKRGKCIKCFNILRSRRYSMLGESYIRQLVNDARKRSKIKGRLVDVDLVEYLVNIGGIPVKCPILNIPLIYKGGGNSPSLDRIDSSLGYIKGNVHIISNRANRIKNDATVDELELIYKYLKKED